MAGEEEEIVPVTIEEDVLVASTPPVTVTAAISEAEAPMMGWFWCNSDPCAWAKFLEETCETWSTPVHPRMMTGAWRLEMMPPRMDAVVREPGEDLLEQMQQAPLPNQEEIHQELFEALVALQQLVMTTVQYEMGLQHPRQYEDPKGIEKAHSCLRVLKQGGHSMREYSEEFKRYASKIQG
ncbi:UNVERIFIED_CONTAM: hypothetical protein K2H54_062181 [Gekko kuhli]